MVLVLKLIASACLAFLHYLAISGDLAKGDAMRCVALVFGLILGTLLTGCAGPRGQMVESSSRWLDDHPILRGCVDGVSALSTGLAATAAFILPEGDQTARHPYNANVP